MHIYEYSPPPPNYRSSGASEDFLQPKRNCAVPTQGEFNNPQRINAQDDRELPSPDSFTVNDDDDDEQSHFLSRPGEESKKRLKMYMQFKTRRW